MPSAFANRLARIAQEQHDRFHRVDESDEPLRSQIERFWTGIGSTFPGVSTAWSAVFVSWCVKQAGANGTEFKFNPAHSQFVHAAIRNGIQSTGLFHGVRVADHAPQVGDIIQHNRGGTTFDFDFAKTHKSYQSHSAIVVEIGTDARGGFAMTVGGNEGNSVRETVVRLNSNGFIKQREINPYICVIKNLK